MFATLRYSQGDEPIRVERQQFAHELGQGRGPHHSACENCRNKKLRCNGKTPSCSRCVEKSIKCQYGTRADHSDASTQFQKQHSRRRPASRKYTSPAEDASSLAVRPATHEAIDIPDDQHTISISNSTPPLAAMEDWLMADVDADSLRSLNEIMPPETSADAMEGPNDPSGHQPYAVIDSRTTGTKCNPPSHSRLYGRPNQVESNWNFDHTISSDHSITTHENLHPSLVALAKTQLTQATFNDYLLGQNQHQTEHDFSPTTLEHHLLAQIAETDLQGTVSSSKECQCWKKVANVLEKIELKSNPDDALEQSSTESILSFQRSAVEKCTMMIGCSYCRSSSERMMVLALIVDKLVGQFEDLTKKYHQELALTALPSPNSSARHDLGTPASVNTPPANSRTGSYFDRPRSAGRRLFLGDYEIYSSEWMPLLKTLIALYAKSLEVLIARCKAWATMTDLSAILAIFIGVERRFRAMSATC